jgi:hypothetical protein
LSIDVLARTQWFFEAKYGLFYFFAARTPAIPLTPDLKNGRWEELCNNFDVDGFVEDVVACGAGYVIFSLGQTTGFWCSPNAFYENKTETLPGQYCSTRDLVAEVADALALKNIRTMVYCSSEGPTAAPLPILERFPCYDDQAGPEARASVNAMITEWSLRWGTKISGWWLDGCFVNGYQNPIDGQANIAAIIAAAQAGNPAAIVACNGSITSHKVVHANEDYLSGEEPGLYRYPYERTFPGVAIAGQVQWHALIVFLSGFDRAVPNGELAAHRVAGDKISHYTDWRCARYKEPLDFTGSDYQKVLYKPEQLAQYIYNCNFNGGVVTIEVDNDQYGRIRPYQIENLQRTKKVIREGLPPKIYSDLARYKPASLHSNSVNGAVNINGEEYWHFPSYGVDGIASSRRYAQAGGEYAYTFQVDLLRPTLVSRVISQFAEEYWATEYAIYTTLNRIDWVLAAGGITGTSGQRKETTFAPVLARWVALKALKPDGPSQEGIQMGVVSFEIYA